MARTTTWPLRASGRGGVSIRANSSKGGAEVAARAGGGKAPRVVGVYGRKCHFAVIQDLARYLVDSFGLTGDPDAVLRFASAASGWSFLRQVWSGPVSRILFPVRGEDHSSAERVAAPVKQPTRKLITETGGSMTSLFGLAPQGVCRAAPTRVGRGALLPHRFTLTSSSDTLRCSRRSAVYSLLHFPSRHRAWPLASLLPVRVRTFLDTLPRRDPPVHSTRRA
jgi:hypothetical protein